MIPAGILTSPAKSPAALVEGDHEASLNANRNLVPQAAPSFSRTTRAPPLRLGSPVAVNGAMAHASVPSRAPFPAQHETSRQPLGGMPKRLTDIAICGTLALVLWPLLLSIALLIKVIMDGPILYAQRRIGREGRAFLCFKFRTMVLDADARLHAHLAENPDAAAEWRETHKLRRDPRVTPLGRLLRRTSFDELPQLYNVLRGDMSCVGPRPIVACEIHRYGPAIVEYFGARPGLTGLWQVSGRTNSGYRRRIALDRYYVRRWSMTLDVIIFLRTLPAILSHDKTD